MSGRLEKDNLIEVKIIEKIKNQPNVVQSYAKSFGNKTVQTKKIYLDNVVKFVDYIKWNFNIDFNNILSLKQLNYSHIVSFMDNYKNYSNTGTRVTKEDITTATVFYSIKHFCKYLKMCKYIDYNICDDYESPRDKKQRQVIHLTEEEIEIVKNNIINGVGSSKARKTQEKYKNRDMCIIMLGITTGLRVSAITNIDIKDIDFNKKTIKVIEKGGIEKSIYLSSKMIELIEKWIEDRNKILLSKNKNVDALFISSELNRISTKAIDLLLKKYTFNIDKKITPHKLRSTAGVNLYEKTNDIYLVAEVLGHSNIQNTKRYADVSNSRKIHAANLMEDFI